MRDSCYPDDKLDVEAKLKVLSGKWSSLQSCCQSQHDQLEDTLLKLSRCQLAELLAWLGKEEERLEANSIAGVVVDKLENQLTDLQVQCTAI